MPLFSIITPLYNKAPYVGKAINSVLAQTFSNWELIVVDDGSTDGSDIIVKSFSDSRIHLILQKNTGVATARNNGVAKASAPYICFLDADDWWEMTYLENMMGLINRNPHAGIYGTGYYIVKNGMKQVAPIGVSKNFTEGPINYCKVYAQTLCMPLWTGAVCIPRAIFDIFQGFKHNLKLGEDFDLWIRIALKYPVVLLNKPLSNYNQDVDTATRGIGKLHDPQHHMLWNLDYLKPEEKDNNDYKLLIDRLRVYDIKPYYLSRQYHAATLPVLANVDWNQQPLRDIRFYHLPLYLIRTHHQLLSIGYAMKKKLVRIVSMFRGV